MQVDPFRSDRSFVFMSNATPAPWDTTEELPFACAEDGGEEGMLSRTTPSVLVISDDSGVDWKKFVHSAGGRLLQCVSLSRAQAPLSMIVGADVILLSCEGNEWGLDAVLARIDSMAISGGCLPVVSVGLAGLDCVFAAIEASQAIILCDADERDLAAAMLIALRRTENSQRLDDIGRESEGEKLERLTDELSRLSQTIEALVQERQPVRRRSERGISRGKNAHAMDQNHIDGRSVLLHSPDSNFAALTGDVNLDGVLQPIDAQQVRSVLRVRRLRDHILAPDLFADPAWDIMLDLMAAHLEGTLVSVSSLCIAAAVPPTTALRWIRQLTDRGLLCRHADPDDGRRIFITLSDEGMRAIHRWFAASRTHLLQASGGES